MKVANQFPFREIEYSRKTQNGRRAKREYIRTHTKKRAHAYEYALTR